MDKAFKELGDKYLSGTSHVHADWKLVREYPPSEKLLALSHVWRSPDRGNYVIAAKGAPEAVADLCHFDARQLAALTAKVGGATAGRPAGAGRGVREILAASALPASIRSPGRLVN